MKKAFIADFGAGNTCLYSTVLDAAVIEPQPLNDPNGEPSGYIRRKNGQILLGMALYGLSYDVLSEVDKFRINLKAKPTKENAAELTFYFKNWLAKLKQERASEFYDVDEAYWFIGFPTGKEWKAPETRKIYTEIFTNAGFENVMLIPESNAALAYYQKTKGVLDNYDSSRSPLLLLDQGAYSLDATVYSLDGNARIKSTGSYLGASLIERMIVRTILYGNEEDNRQQKSIHNMPDVLSESRALYEKADGKFKTFLLLRARTLKEDYFTQERNHMLQKSWDVIRPANFVSQNGHPLMLFTNEKMMKRILFTDSVKSILGPEFATLPPEVQEELGNYSWMQAFTNFLNKVISTYPQVAASSAKARIMLTGGGSRMMCVYEATKKKFPSAIVYDDPKAITAIGMGMAYWAPDKVKANRFSDKFLDFLSQETTNEDGDEVNAIASLVNNKITSCISSMIGEFIKEESSAVVDSISAWMDYDCSSSSIPTKIRYHFENWLKNTGRPHFLKNIDQCIDDVKQEVQKSFSAFQKKHGMDPVVLFKPNDNIFLSDTKTILSTMLDLIAKDIPDHYKNHQIFSVFPDANKGLFSDPRKKFVAQNSDDLKEWMDAEINATVEIYANIFYESEIDYMGEKRTFMACFRTEALYDLLNLMDDRKTEILGKLVLEEYLED